MFDYRTTVVLNGTYCLFVLVLHMYDSVQIACLNVCCFTKTGVEALDGCDPLRSCTGDMTGLLRINPTLSPVLVTWKALSHEDFCRFDSVLTGSSLTDDNNIVFWPLSPQMMWHDSVTCVKWLALPQERHCPSLSLSLLWHDSFACVEWYYRTGDVHMHSLVVTWNRIMLIIINWI